jgi:hypothetical protein
VKNFSDYSKLYMANGGHIGTEGIIGVIFDDNRDSIDLTDSRVWFQSKEAISLGWSVVMEDEADVLEDDDVATTFSRACFLEGEKLGIMRMGLMLGLNPKIFEEVIGYIDWAGGTTLTPKLIEAIRSGEFDGMNGEEIENRARVLLGVD